jgi:hypothetical protein
MTEAPLVLPDGYPTGQFDRRMRLASRSYLTSGHHLQARERAGGVTWNTLQGEVPRDESHGMACGPVAGSSVLALKLGSSTLDIPAGNNSPVQESVQRGGLSRAVED